MANGLAVIPDTADVILIHDAARPNGSPDLVRSVLRRLDEGDVDGVVPGLSVTDTIKLVDGEAVERVGEKSIVAALDDLRVSARRAVAIGEPVVALRDEQRDLLAVGARRKGTVVFVERLERVGVSAEVPEDLAAAPGAKAKAKVQVHSSPEAIVVPKAALKDGNGDSRQVEVRLADGETEQRDVQVGRSSGDDVEILSGLEAGQAVVVPEKK